MRSSCVSKLLNHQIAQCLPQSSSPVRFIKLIFLYFNFLVWKMEKITISTLFVKIKPGSYYNYPITYRSSSHGSYFKSKHINICDIKLMFPLLVFKLFNVQVSNREFRSLRICGKSGNGHELTVSTLIDAISLV